MHTYTSHYIHGEWIKAESNEFFSVYDSSTEALFATVPLGTAREAESAVSAARAAWPAWSSLSIETRAAYLEKISKGIEARGEEFALAIAREVGTPLKMARAVQVAPPVWHWANFANVARGYAFEEKVGNSLVVREPIGVVSCITPWNFPLHQITLKVAPAMAAGCTVVLKPSELAPVAAMMLTEIIHDAGVPPGVFNLINGTGPVVGEVLAAHPEVDMVTFTGSTGAGKRVAALASQTVKRVTLELGGKSASIILPDADLVAAVNGTISACMLNSGQTCSAHTRMLIPEGRYEEVKALAESAIARLSIGPSLEEGSKLGPLVSSVQRDRVLAFIQQGIADGAEIMVGGDKPISQSVGYFVHPTILRVKPEDMLAREEIFGPVLVVITYRDEEHAIRIANDSIYGLGGAVWSGNEAHAIDVARKLRTGQVDINGGPFNSKAPFGGYKQSGNGRENGRYGFEEFLEIKSIQLKIHSKSS